MKNNILFMIHCEQNTGYAIEKLESVFLASALNAGYKEDQIHWSFSQIKEEAERTYELDFHNQNVDHELSKILKKNYFDTILAFDLPFPSSIVSTAKKNGVGKIISYWGASMSGLNTGLKLALKKLEHSVKKKNSADLYIFESKAMQLTATHGRGIPESRTCVIPLGVDTEEYYPSEDKAYIHDQLDIPENRKVVFYSGHMEERKGVRVIIRAAIELASQNKISNLHFVLCGNKGNEADTYINELVGSKAREHVTFAGYRTDLPQLMRSSYIGVIASTGWDSFTRSSIEMLASGLPLLASNLGGLSETTSHGTTGYLFRPGNYRKLAEYLAWLTSNRNKYEEFSEAARNRAISNFEQEKQIISLSKAIL